MAASWRRAPVARCPVHLGSAASRMLIIGTLFYISSSCLLCYPWANAAVSRLCQPRPNWTWHDTHDGNASQVTLVALTSLNDNRSHPDAWLDNLERIRNHLVGQFPSIRFILVNLKDSHNPVWVERARQNVSFEVYQETESSPIGSTLDGSSGDVFIYDRCNLLAYYIPFPLSFLHQEDPFFQVTILAAHSDSPCREQCPASRLHQNTSEVTTVPVTESPTTQAPPSNIYSEVGEVLKSFYDRYAKTFESHEEPQPMTTRTSTSTTTVPELQPTALADGTGVRADLSALRPPNRTQPPDVGCNRTICWEWTTEKLLAARLCCLSFHAGDDPDNQNELMINVNASDYVPSNGGFGCKLYARSTCSMIKPVIRCCARQLVNEYFNYAIRQREKQQKMELQPMGAAAADKQPPPSPGQLQPTIFSGLRRQQHRKRKIHLR